jgi:hypothetical protein
MSVSIAIFGTACAAASAPETNDQEEQKMAHGHAHAEHGVLEGRNKIVALLIAIFALFLAFSETLGKSAQTAAISYNVAAEAMQVELASYTDPTIKEAAAKRVDYWQRAAARYDSEPETQEGRKELMVRAKAAEEKRDSSMAKYHHYELASAAFQIAIVLASATVITGMLVLTYIAAGLSLTGLIFMSIGLFAPHAVHLF